MMNRAPFFMFFVIAFLSVATMALSNMSCQYLNYPTQVMFKSCKVLPVMIVGVVFLRKKYELVDYLSICAVAVGLVLTSVSDRAAFTDFDPLGVILISLALVADAIIGNVQEATLGRYKVSTGEIMYYTKVIGAALLFASLD